LIIENARTIGERAAGRKPLSEATRAALEPRQIIGIWILRAMA
jgi:hypothetical protein